MSEESSDVKQSGFSLGRLIPLVVLAAGLVAFFVLGLNEYVNLETLKENRQLLQELVADYALIAALIYIGGYAVAVAFSIPVVCRCNSHWRVPVWDVLWRSVHNYWCNHWSKGRVFGSENRLGRCSERKGWADNQEDGGGVSERRFLLSDGVAPRAFISLLVGQFGSCLLRRSSTHLRYCNFPGHHSCNVRVCEYRQWFGGVICPR